MKMGVARYEQALCCTRRGGESTSVAIGCPRSRRISGPYVLACALACACARVFVRLRLCMDAVGMHGACACSAWRRAEGALCGCVRCSDEDSERGSLIGDARSIEHKQLGWGGSGGSSPSRKDAAMTARVSPPSAVVSLRNSKDSCGGAGQGADAGASRAMVERERASEGWSEGARGGGRVYM